MCKIQISANTTEKAFKFSCFITIFHLHPSLVNLSSIFLVENCCTDFRDNMDIVYFSMAYFLERVRIQ